MYAYEYGLRYALTTHLAFGVLEGLVLVGTKVHDDRTNADRFTSRPSHPCVYVYSSSCLAGLVVARGSLALKRLDHTRSRPMATRPAAKRTRAQPMAPGMQGSAAVRSYQGSS